MLGFGQIFHEEFFELRTPTSPVQSSSWESCQRRLCMCSPPPLLCMCWPPHAPVRSQGSVSWKGVPSRERRSYVGNPATQTAESLFLGPQVHPDTVNVLERFASLCSFFFLLLPHPTLSLSPTPPPPSLSLGHFQKESNTDINTGLVQSLFHMHTIHY